MKPLPLPMIINLPLPKSIRGLCFFRKIIIINKRLDTNTKNRTLKHELLHASGHDEYQARIKS